MRPVNLIPAEERPGGRRPLRSGPLAYIVVGALAAVVIALTALVVTENKISERKDEVAQLQQQQQSVEAQAKALAPYSQFAAVREQRVETVEGLANSRFDWERVLQELSLLLPRGVQITSLTGTASPEVALSGGAGISLRAAVAGPALELVGCGPSQTTVAGFVEAVKDIDGVTRVALQNATRSKGTQNASSGSGSCGGDHWVQFQMVAAFDAAPVAPAETGEEVVVPEATEEGGSEGESESSESESESSESSGGEGEGGAE